MLKFIKNNYFYILLLTPVNLVALSIIFVTGLSIDTLNAFLLTYFVILIAFGLSIFLLKQKHKIELLKMEKRELEKSRNSSLEYIDALWQSQEGLIQDEKLSSLNSLVAGVAHELNTPLGVSLTAVSYLEELIKSKKGRSILENAAPMLNLTMTNLQKSITLVEKFKEIAGSSSYDEMTPVDLKEFIDFACCRVNSEKAIGNKHKIVYNLPEDLWVNISQMSLSVIIKNIIENAYDFAFNPEDEGVIKISAQSDNFDLIIEIEDNGKGIPSKNIRHIFDPFFTTKRANKHYGLGLAISYNLLTRHYNGKIACISTTGKGTRFTISIPDAICKKPVKKKVTTSSC